MRKALILFFVIVGLGFFLLPAALITAEREREHIILTEEVLSGNPDAAAGITLQIASHWNRHLLWDTKYTIGSANAIKSQFTFSGKTVSWGWEQKQSAKLYFGAGESMLENDRNSSKTSTEFAFPKIATSVARRATEIYYSETVRIGDYYDLYPLLFRVEGGTVQYDSYYKAAEYLTELFHILPAQDKLEVTVKKYSSGKIDSLIGRKVVDDSSISLVSMSAFGQKGLYYTYRLEGSKIEYEENVNRGQNMGVFFIPYKKEGELLYLELMRTAKIFEFSKDVVPLELKLDEEENFLYLAAKKKDGYYLFVYCPDGGTILTEEILLENIVDTSSFCQMSFVNGGVLLTWNDNQFSFVAEEKGGHRWWCSGIFPQTMEELDEEGVQNPFPRENACMFDGTRLALAAFENWKNMGIQLMICDETGELYCGRYKNSQDTALNLVAKSRICPQGARLWAPNSAWSARKEDAVVIPILLK